MLAKLWEPGYAASCKRTGDNAVALEIIRGASLQIHVSLIKEYNGIPCCCVLEESKKVCFQPLWLVTQVGRSDTQQWSLRVLSNGLYF